MRRVVIDAGLLAAACVKPGGEAGTPLRSALEGEADLHITREVLDELSALMRTPFFMKRIRDPMVINHYLDLLAGAFSEGP